ncbi:MAG: aminodeoxychorismate synthase component I [Bacteroidota bacterium]
MMGHQPETQAVFHLLEVYETDLPFWRFFEVFRADPHAYFLDSSLAEQTLGRFSFMGSNPFMVYRAFAALSQERGASSTRGGVQVSLEYFHEGGSKRERYEAVDLFDDLRSTFEAYEVPPASYNASKLPFYAGGVGYLAYEAGALIEAIPTVPVDHTGLPVACFLFVDHAFAYCHTSGKSYLSVLGRGKDEAEARAQAQMRMEGLRNRLDSFARCATTSQDAAAPAENIASFELEAEHSRESYIEAVKTVKSHIREGDVYEVCLTHGYTCTQQRTPWALYQSLREINPAPFSSFLQLPEVQVVCSSPERFLHLDSERNIESRPIKGTRRRGETLLHDLQLEDELQNSEKDRAENLMIVDLVRNDLSRVSEIGSVHVPQLLRVERYATVLQLVSAIRGKLAAQNDLFDLIKACFPGGSMTGAPKIEAMKVIASLEKSTRGIYSGAIGYIDFAGTLDLNIVIRSIVVADGKCYFNVGGAIVSDSDPVAEYEETLDKARALVTALRT